MPGQLTNTALPKRISLIFLWAEFDQRDPMPIVKPLPKTVCVFGGRWGVHSYLASPKYKIQQTNLEIGFLSL